MKPEEMFEAYLEDLNHGSELRKEITEIKAYFRLLMYEVVNFERVKVRKMTFPADQTSTAVSYMSSWEKECKEDKTRDYVISLDFINKDNELINIGVIRITKGVNK